MVSLTMILTVFVSVVCQASLFPDLVFGLGWGVVFNGEFDPGSGRTLAACLTHASRTVNRFRVGISGERVSNTWAICPSLWDNSGKPGLIPDDTERSKFRRPRMSLRLIS